MLSKFAVLSLASTALAVPTGYTFYGSASGIVRPTGTGAPYPAGNGTGPYGSGTGTGTAPGTAPGTGYYKTAWVTVTDVVTAGYGYASDVNAAGYGAPGTPSCSTPTVSSTTTRVEYVTVTPVPATSSASVEVAAVGYPALSSSSKKHHKHHHLHTKKPVTSKAAVAAVVSSPAAPAAPAVPSVPGLPVQISLPVNYPVSVPAVSIPAVSIPHISIPVYSAPAAPVYSAPAAAVYSAPAAAAYSAPAVAKTTTTTPAAAATTQASTYNSGSSGSTSSGSTGGKGKRGVAYNDPSMALPYASSSQVSWAYNWGSQCDGLDTSDFEYVPMLWGTGSGFLANWVTAAKTALGEGAKHILSFNEPDLPSQSNMSPAEAAAGYLTHINSLFAGQGVKLGAPAVTNGGGSSMGLGWLSSFMSACSECQIDFVALHWYDSASNAAYFKQHVQQAHQQTGKPVWVTEFGCTDGSDAEISSFLEDVMGWMDEQSYVERYAYFMAKDGILNSGSGLSSYGQTYADYSG